MAMPVVMEAAHGLQECPGELAARRTMLDEMSVCVVCCRSCCGGRPRCFCPFHSTHTTTFENPSSGAVRELASIRCAVLNLPLPRSRLCSRARP